ncbi:maintenance of telomere capping protein 6 [[Candida] jaroonii]|uniref:Maintenance of telomere capping protein 6 n=1 Tax=[Candida] jaroonii TaxID=467808 RepID=A0ACA9Y2N8_9ASCO|nr:maintenance of telomere capping protein 6 [[Candida] jaroonii]
MKSRLELTMRIRQLVISLLISVVFALDNWPTLTFDAQVALRTQRDISWGIPIDQVGGFGVDLSSMLFDKEGYSYSSTTYFDALMTVGVSSLVIDLYWNNFTSKWQLCPAPYPLNQTNMADVQTINWNDQTYKCQPSFTTDSIMQQISQYLGSTNTNMNVNYLKLFFRLNKFKFPTLSRNSTLNWDETYGSKTSPYKDYGNDTLSDTLSGISSFIYTPEDLSSFQSAVKSSQSTDFYNKSSNPYPRFDTFIFTNLKRITPIVMYDEVTGDGSYNFTDADVSTLFIDGKSVNITYEELGSSVAVEQCLSNVFNLSSVTGDELFRTLALDSPFRMVSDNEKIHFNDASYRSLIRCGFTPILNSSSYEANSSSITKLEEIMDHFIPLSFWSWGSDLINSPNSDDSDVGDNTISSVISQQIATITEAQSTTSEVDKEVNAVSSDESNRAQEAEKCVCVKDFGWSIENCYNSYPFACQNHDNPNDWVIVTDLKQYFNAYKSCPDGYSFSVPHSNIEMLALMSEASKHTNPFPIWIDVNDITVTNCFVSGGPYAECPYQNTISTKGLTGMIAPSFVTIVVVLGLLFLEKVFRTNPIQTNKKRYWKRTINDHNKKFDYEGVPS